MNALRLPTGDYRLARAARIGLAFAMAMAATLVLRPVAAQDTAPRLSIDAGMTRDEVTRRLGFPVTESHFGSFTYLYYDAGCGKKCKDQDVVVLDKGIVSDAMFKSGKRVYTGTNPTLNGQTPAPTGRFSPEPIHASTSTDSARRGGIVFATPRAPMRPPRYSRVVPKAADTIRNRAPGSAGAKPSDSTARHSDTTGHKK